MKVAMLGPIAWRTPPEHYGPWEKVTSLLTEGLVARGADVTLFATGDSVTAADLSSVSPHGYAEDPSMDGRVWEALHVAAALSRSGDFDLVHNQLDWLPLAFSDLCAVPMVTTLHGFSGPGILPAYLRGTSSYVAISDADRSAELDYVATIPHGIDVAGTTFRDTPGDGLVSFGRIHPDKGTSVAVAIARACNRPLTICGIIQDQAYFDAEIAPTCDGDRVRYLGSVAPAERDAVLGAAVALLHPVAFDEPFGLSVVEAMACGTPVVAFRRGSMGEVIDEGVTGYLVDTVAEAVTAVADAARLDRRLVRARAARRFSVATMVERYLEVYASVLEQVGA